MKKCLLAAKLCLLISLVFLQAQNASAQNNQADNTQLFWNSLKKLCGKAYTGKVLAAPADDTTFKDKDLVMHIRACEENRIRIPFSVGTDRSRTWVLSRKDGKLILKHDHRHEDGTPDKVTQYGGTTTNSGMATRQVFPADQETFNILPAAAPNVWWIEIIDGQYFSYNLRRMGSERFFSIRFDITKEIKAPEAPWGWKE